MWPLPPQTTGSEGVGACVWGSNRAGVQVLRLTLPKSQGPMELGVHDFLLPQIKWPHGWVDLPACPTPPWGGCVYLPPLPTPADPAPPALEGQTGAGPTPQPRVGVPGYAAGGGSERGGRLQEASL